jgi:hypothetical protein
MLPIHLRQDGYVRCDSCGWAAPAVSRPSPQEQQQGCASAMKGYGPTLETFQLGAGSTQAVRLVLEECRRHSIKAALVLMPEGPVFRGLYSARVWEQIDPFLEQLHQELAATVVNARFWIEEEDFFDSHHLAPDGAARFTQRLGREVIVPTLRGSDRGPL